MNILAKNIMKISLKAKDKEKEDQIGSLSSFYVGRVQKENVLNPIIFFNCYQFQLIRLPRGTK